VSLEAVDGVDVVAILDSSATREGAR
jgi:hypothetical protein